MSDFLKWFANSPLASALRVALGYFLGAMVAHFAQVNAFDFSQWQAWLVGAIVVSTPILLRWINPSDSAYGAK